MKLGSAKKTLFVALPLGMLLGIAGTVLAADPRLDEAGAHVDQAIALLTAADNPKAETKDKKEFGGHRHKAIELLKSAQKEIAKAKEFADKDAGAPGPKDPKPHGPKDPKPAPSAKPMKPAGQK